MLSLTITDTQNQTAAVFRALARDGAEPEVDLSPWRALQMWLARGPAVVTIPFAERLGARWCRRWRSVSAVISKLS